MREYSDVIIQHHETADTWWVKIYISGPIETVKDVCRQECYTKGLCVTVTPTHFIYTGGEEAGVEVGLINYPRFLLSNGAVTERARILSLKLLEATYQHSVLVMTPETTEWVSRRK